MDFDFFSFLLGALVGTGISYALVWILGRAIYQRLAEAVEENIEEAANHRIEMKVEQHGNMLYAFRSEDDGFVCQGTNLQELKKQFVQQFPGYTGSMVGKTDELHKELLKQLKEIKNEDSSSIGSSS
jgi:hypothetical protein